MKFNFVPNYTIESDNPDVFVVIAGAVRESGLKFVLHMNGKQIGFATAESIYDEIFEKCADGSRVWHIGVLGCAVIKTERDGDGVYEPDNLNVPAYSFESEEELKQAMQYIEAALSTYSGRVDSSKQVGLNPVFHEDQGEVRVCFTPELLKKVESGVLLK